MQIANGFSWRKRKIQYIQILFFSVKLSLANFETFLGRRYLFAVEETIFPASLSPRLYSLAEISYFFSIQNRLTHCVS